MKSIEQIGAELEGYDPNALRADKVNAFLAEMVSTVTQTESVSLFEALNRVLAEDVISPISVPPHDNSAMDGFAFNGAQLSTNAALNLNIVGTALAGKAWQGHVERNECLKIMTGAIMPAGLDTVVPQELVTLSADKTQITIASGMLKVGDNRRKAGEDLQQGSPALLKGAQLSPATLGLIASLGLAKVNVYRKIRVAYFSTGDEILSLGEAPREGAVYDSNRYTVFGLLTRMGCEVIDMGVVRDEPDLLEAAFVEAAKVADAIITSGGVSVGEADYTRAMMKKLGATTVDGGVAFWRIAMRPGRPMAFLAFVRPALLRMMGSSASSPPLLKARSTEAIRKKPGRTEYQRGTVSTSLDGTLEVRTTGNQGSGVLSSMVQANGLIVLHHDQSSVAIGDEIDVMMFDGVI
jgi:molybdopterin molybdotransferase